MAGVARLVASRLLVSVLCQQWQQVSQRVCILNPSLDLVSESRVSRFSAHAMCLLGDAPGIVSSLTPRLQGQLLQETHMIVDSVLTS